MLFLSRRKQERNINMKYYNYAPKQTNIQSFRKYHFNHLSLADRLNIEKLINLKNDKNYKGQKLLLPISLELLVLMNPLYLEKLNVVLFIIIIKLRERLKILT